MRRDSAKDRTGKSIFRKKAVEKKRKLEKGKSLCLDTLARERFHKHFTGALFMLPHLRNHIFQTEEMPQTVFACYRVPAKDYTTAAVLN